MVTEYSDYKENEMINVVEICKEVLKRLLELNHKIHEEEFAAGLWDKKKVVKKKSNVVNDPFEPYNQPELIGEDILFIGDK